MSDKQLTIFYSWQSWTEPEKGSNNNRNFIDDALKRAAKQVARENEVPVIVTRDTEGKPGHPAIMETIMKRIDSSDIYVADVSYVMNDRGRYTPNPNVMIELGYALKQLSGSRLILIMNTVHGSPKDHAMPFDFQHRRFPITYHLEPNADSNIRKQEREKLTSILKSAIEQVVGAGLINSNQKLVAKIAYSLRMNDIIERDQLFEHEIKKIYDELHEEKSHEHQSKLAGSGPPSQILNYYLEMCRELLEAFALLVRYYDDNSTYFEQALRLWTQKNSNELYVRFLPSSLLIYTVGTAIFLHGKWDILPQILLGEKIKYPDFPQIQDHIANISIDVSAEAFIRGKYKAYNLGEELKPVVKQLLSEHYISNSDFEYAYVSFEILLILQYIHTHLKYNLTVSIPRQSESTIICNILNDWGRKVRSEKTVDFLVGGILDNGLKQLNDVLTRYTSWRNEFRGDIINYRNCFENPDDY